MTLINDKLRPQHNQPTEQLPRYTLAVIGPDNLVRFFVEMKAGIPGSPSPARLAVLENGKIIASIGLEA